MTVHQLFPARPPLAPILFPIDSMDQMLLERATAHILADMAHRIPAHIIARQAAWATRLSARIERISQ